MPLIEGASVLSAKANYSRLIGEGYPENQAFAITVGIIKANIHKVSPERRRDIEDRRFFRWVIKN